MHTAYDLQHKTINSLKYWHISGWPITIVTSEAGEGNGFHNFSQIKLLISVKTSWG